MHDGPVLKHVPADFLVRESMVVPLADAATADWHYLVLRKRGYTTMEAVRLIAERLQTPTTRVTYGGLKDEDGITEQLVAVPARALPVDGAGPLWERHDGERRLALLHYGHGHTPLTIGRLEGNGFRVVVRNLTPHHASRLATLRKINLFFLNYYDTQRFGVPGGPKRTHHVGAAVLAGEWDKALAELVELRAPESALAERWQGPARDFFLDLDPRTTSFYLAAHGSHRWNAALGEAVYRACPDRWYPVELDGLAYRYASSVDAVTAVLGTARELPYARYGFEDGRPVEKQSLRPTTVQTTVTVTAREPDAHHPGAYQVTLGFFLPSGCYATAAVRQLLAFTRPDDEPADVPAKEQR